ncbi:MAG: DUF3891 family protein [Bacillota bacterium]
MIVYEDNASFIMTEQHEHAMLSEGFAQHWKDTLFHGVDMRDSVLYAIAQHDRSWIDVDESPIWNDETNKPFTFIDFPISMKLHFYRIGIDEIEEQNPYAALLCSIHYTRFFSGITDENRIFEYVNKEHSRQKRLLNALNLVETDNNLVFHYNLLKFCDNISLFVCMQEAGAVYESMHNWFKNGLAQPFSFFTERNFNVVWKSEKEIIVKPFPFSGEFELSIHLRKVPKVLVKKHGILEAFHKTPIHSRTVKITAK